MFRTRAQSLFCVAVLALVLLCAGASAQAAGLAPSLAGAVPAHGPAGGLAGGTTFSDPDCARGYGHVICVASGPLTAGYGSVQQIEPLAYPPPYSPTAGRWDPTPGSGGIIQGGPSLVILPASGARAIFMRGTDNHLWVRTHEGGSWGGYQQLDPVIYSDPDCLNFPRYSGRGRVRRPLVYRPHPLHLHGPCWRLHEHG